MSLHHIKRLIVMRHAKADWPWGVEDHERPLQRRGHEDAAAAGLWLKESELIPDFIVCSDALRTRQSCTWVCNALGEKAPTPLLEPELYQARPERMLAVINHVPETVTSLLLIAHLPGVQDLALHLASRDSDQGSYMDLAERYPTSALSVFNVEKPWAELDGQDAKLVAFEVPRA